MTLSKDDHSIWKANKKPKCHIPPIRKANGKWAKSNKEKADNFVDYVAHVFMTTMKLNHFLMYNAKFLFLFFFCPGLDKASPVWSPTSCHICQIFLTQWHII